MAAPSPRGHNPCPNVKLAKARRGHTKSRRGCFECKRRHIKCDERHPICANCSMGERQCVYPEKSRKSVVPDSSSVASRSTSPTPVVRLEPPELGIEAPALHSLTAQEEGTTINILHLELLHHFTNDTFVPDMGRDLLDSARLVVETGFHAPYLMYETLAISARRLACVRHSMRDMYLHHAMQLQTHAISLFNTDKEELDKSSCVAKLLFSSLLGRHLLSDALANREGDFDSFLVGYIRYLRLHRSVRNLTADAWPFLMQSELGPAISWGEAIFKLRTRGHHCDGILHLLLSAKLNDRSREACRQAIHFLQVGFDEAQSGGSQWRTIHVILWWSILMPQEYVEMLVHRRPEAIVILGYYAALLQYGQKIWLIGDAGAYLLDAITRYLGSEWAEWIAGPRELIPAA